MYAVCAFMAVVGAELFKDPNSAITCVTIVMVSLGAFFYTSRARRIVKSDRALQVSYLSEALVLIPVDRWSTITKKALSVALQLRGQVRVVHLDVDAFAGEVEELWQRNVVSPLRSAGGRIPELIVLKSQDTYALSPMAEYVLEVERAEPNRQIVVVVPGLAVRHWWQKPLHNYRNCFLRWILYARGSQRIMIIDVPWFL